MTVKIKTARDVTTSPVLANLTATNATLSNIQANNNYYDSWNIDVTPLASGPVTVGINAGVLAGRGPDQNKRNASGSLTMTAELGAPKLIWADFTSRGARWYDDGPYRAGSVIDLTVIFSEHVTVSGAPTVRLRTRAEDAGSYDAVYHSGSGSSALVFRHTVPAGGYGPGFTTIEAGAIALPPSASITDADGNAASLVLPPQLEWVETLAQGRGTGLPQADPAVGDVYRFVAVFSEPVTVSSDENADPPHFVVRIETNAGTLPTVRAVYSSGSGTRRLTFQYVVTAEDDVKRVRGINTSRLRVPQGSGIRSAAGIDANTRLAEDRDIRTGYREGTQVRLPFQFQSTIAAGADITLHLISGDPARVSLEPSSLLYRDFAMHPGDWEGVRWVVATLHADGDAVDNDVEINWRMESTAQWVDGATGTSRILRISDGVGGPPCFLELVLSVADDFTSIRTASWSSPGPARSTWPAISRIAYPEMWTGKSTGGGGSGSRVKSF